MSKVQIAERESASTSSPIDGYLERVRGKLISRFEEESVSLVLREIETHLAESASEIEASGVSRPEAERQAVAKFGAPECNSYFVLLASSLGHGDRLWGRIAYWIAIAAAIGITAFGLVAPNGYVPQPSAVGSVFAVLLLAYGLACARAKAFSLTGKTIGTMAAIVAFAAILDPDVSNPSEVAHSSARLALDAPSALQPGRLASGRLAGEWVSDGVERRVVVPGLVLAGLGPDSADGQLPRLELLGNSGPPSSRQPGSAPTHRGEFGMCRLDSPSWLIGFHGWVPDAARLGIVWLLFVLLTNGAVWWISSLQRLQENGLLSVQ